MTDRVRLEGAPRVVREGEGRVLVPGMVFLKTSARETNGAFEVFELVGPMGPPPHIHREREEYFCVVEGLYEFTLGEETVEAGAGSVVFIPRGTRHAITPKTPGKAFVFVSPAGLEGFFEELGAGMAARKSQDEIRRTLEGKYDSHPVAGE